MVLQKLLKAIKELEVGKIIIDKTKKNIKYLDISINVAYNFPTFYPSVPFSTLVIIAKHIAIAAAQANISQAKATTKACAYFLANTIL